MPSPPRRKAHREKRRDRERNRSVGRERRRSGEREMSRDRSRERRERDRERDLRQRDYRRRSRSRSRSYDRDRGRDKSPLPSSSRRMHAKPVVSEADLEGKSPEEQEMLKTMGFCGFDSTKGRKVEGNNVGEVHVILKRKYRQYMNRKGGFNRPLDFVA